MGESGFLFLIRFRPFLLMKIFSNKIICPETGEDITDDVIKELVNGVNMQRLRAMKAQREAAIYRQRMQRNAILRDVKGNAIARQKAFIHPLYYHSVIAARKDENKYLKEHNLNTWDDEEFLQWELKHNPAIRPNEDKEVKFYQISNKGQKAPIFRPSFNIHDKKYDIV